ncbi:hypothetical protein ACFCYM_34760 [Streptomyces sp. NPDC056254]|uniref:hypothetical protein n=1 Tax=Streptomyces sp. NPDC056254 TaxID=3345763 RepID=UPI0035E28CDA
MALVEILDLHAVVAAAVVEVADEPAGADQDLARAPPDVNPFPGRRMGVALPRKRTVRQ